MLDNKPPITSTQQELPFDKLSPRDFERLCFDLVEREGFGHAEHLGAAGSEQGRDIIAWRDGKLWAFQCKRVDKFGPAAARREAEKVLALPEAERPAVLVFLVTCDVSDRTRRAARQHCAGQIECHFWARTELDAKVSWHPAIVDKFFRAAAQAATSLHQLPAPPADFTGRAQELADLQAALAAGATICGLRGLGGIGKTALALKLAELLTPSYPDAQFFLDLKGISTPPLSTAEAMAHIIHAYHPRLPLPDSQDGLDGLYRSVLHSQRALVLMDNAADVDQVTPLLPPAGTGSLLLVTSRRHFTLPGLVAYDLDTLSSDDAKALLLRIAGRVGEEYAGEIAQLCGCLPLALRLAGSALAERMDLSPVDYLRRLGKTQTRLEMVEASFSLSYELLDEDMRHLWGMLAVFPGTFDRSAAAAVWELEPDPAQDALSELVRFSLVEWDAATQRYRLHDLARLFAYARLSEGERDLGHVRHAAHYIAVARTANELYLQGGAALQRGLALFDLERGNIQAGQAWATEHSERDETAARLCSNYPAACVDCLDLRHHPQEQVVWLKAAVAAAQRLGDRFSEGNHLGNLGLAYYSLGQMEWAIEHYQQALTISREICAASTKQSAEWKAARLTEGNSLGSLGLAYISLQRVKEAIKQYRQALAISREIRAASTERSVEWMAARRAEGTWLGNLGRAHYSLGQMKRAIKCYRQALAISREIGDRRDEGVWLGFLGMIYAAQGQVEQEIEHYQQALTISREIGDRYNEGAWLSSLGVAYATLEQREQATEHHQQALVIFEELKSPHAEWVRCKLVELAQA